MTIRISADRSHRNIGAAAATSLGPIAVWVGFSVWQNYSLLLILCVSVPLAALSLCALAGRGSWSQVEVNTESITLIGSKRTVNIKRQAVIMLEVRDNGIVMKWHSEPKAEVTVLGREHFNSQSWNELCSSLRPWDTTRKASPEANDLRL